ncbi:hypothetical protein OG787_51350 [Streptomyces sp. NBC_00075]|uniref:hypothetical protein n=1 Tax=Streptomyces sp. NBC_00075 TaxID=2975641 RepID=UPI0032524080
MTTRYRARIEVRDIEGTVWQAIDSEYIEEHTGTASDYGRRLLTKYLRENPNQARNARVQIWEMDDIDGCVSAPSDILALIDDPVPVPPEIAAIEAAKEDVLRRRRALEHSIEQLNTRLREARRIGHRGDRLAELAHPALAREYL